MSRTRVLRSHPLDEPVLVGVCVWPPFLFSLRSSSLTNPPLPSSSMRVGVVKDRNGEARLKK